ncbi:MULTISPECIES: hypothetical protein [Aeromonas]|uniref:hypothetical protein n=1 Tax=Aeromonas TaxID=642 RepID=UPI001CC6BA96|nr:MULTISPECIES: hypothetical protein [Aeromonas]USP09008.1 hypothetical protein L1S45_17800 [Aeromonas dhakensis]GJC06120.1 hypothetical protein KAM385_31490 [Aeromonas hydrophila]
MQTKQSELINHFIRGAVAGGLLSALQGRVARSSDRSARKILRHSLQGGFAVATGLGVANALEQGDYQQAGILLLGGAVGIASAEHMLATVKEKKRG